jgi:hypothetical protein
MDDVLLENRKLKAELQILQARYHGKSAAADHFFNQYLGKRRRLTTARRAPTDIAENEPWLRALNADYVVDIAKRAIEEIE